MPFPSSPPSFVISPFTSNGGKKFRINVYHFTQISYIFQLKAKFACLYLLGKSWKESFLTTSCQCISMMSTSLDFHDILDFVLILKNWSWFLDFFLDFFSGNVKSWVFYFLVEVVENEIIITYFNFFTSLGFCRSKGRFCV